ncbi:L,D-transpeptidase family protein [Anaeromicropila herbilytica]|uniref:L,D-TPase catalytic domain-containing protein n=1 Tax=Anaeromicropila herbilytica TaxID=2785025 RepID=A0A7R7ID40_9FIRM|nr:L,D-transpeptidase family protein [Anaeromicropila herbilytica]BCN31383.1 hypothetical protein bsdtb5_26780 [Anaeromicropila herbilytica]
MEKQKNLFKMNTILLIILTCLAFFIMIYIGFSIYFKSHFLFGTYINDVNYSGKSIEKVEQSITNRIDTYVLKLEERGNKKEYIASSDIDMKATLDDSVQKVLNKQKPYLWISSLWQEHHYDVGVAASYDEKLLKKAVDQLECFKEDKVEKPVDAYISDYSANGYQIVEAVQGNQVDKKKLYTKVKDAINHQNKKLSLEDEDCYIKPKYTADSKELQQALEKLNEYIDTTITYQFGDVKEVVDASVISQWLEVNDNMKVVINPDSVKKYVDYLGYTYNTFGKKRDFKTSYNKTIKVIGGDYGWWLNRGAEVKELIAAVKKGDDILKEPNYYQKARSYGEYDFGDTYVEVNLKEQHLFFYKEGKLIVDSDFVSGNVSKGHGTPIGTYSITYKQRDATLVGENYSTPVHYWMPFNNNIGLHDASWRSEFGGKIYLTRGSHGCVNLPPAVAKKIYENIEKGTAVICYELEVDGAKEGTQDNASNDGVSTNENSDVNQNNSLQDNAGNNN